MLLVTPLWFPIRSRRQSGGHGTSGLPGSSTERPIAPELSQGPHRFALAAPNGAATDPTVGHPLVFPGVPTIYPTRFPRRPATVATGLEGRA